MDALAFSLSLTASAAANHQSVRLSGATGRSSAGAHRLLRSDKGAHEFVLDLRRDSIDVDTLAAQERTRVLDVINARGLDRDLIETSPGELCDVVGVFERACN